LKLELARSLAAVVEIHDAIAAYCADHGVGEAAVFAVQLAVEELFTNLVRHNRGGGETIVLEFERAGDHLAIMLVDRDVDRFDPAEVPAVDVNAPLEARRPGGLGLHLVRTYLDDVSYRYADRTLRITARKDLEE
jgi:serine/threonine-protein kinase RsbW